jgi:hypothetical protein
MQPLDEQAMNMLLAFQHSHSPYTRDELVELIECIQNPDSRFVKYTDCLPDFLAIPATTSC